MPFGRKRKTVDPGQAHAFVPQADEAIPAVASGGFLRSGNVTSVAVTSAYLRDDPRCGLAGCGRPRSHDLHSVATD